MSKENSNDDKVVNMIEIFANSILIDLDRAAADYKVAGGTNANLACNVSWKDELAVVPCPFDLLQLVNHSKEMLPALTLFPRM